jgi:hypothetical protein
MMVKWIAELKQKTGRSLEEWVRYINKEGPATEAERRDWLKRKHHLGTNTAWWLAERSVGKGGEEDTPETYLKAAVRYVEGQYSGKKAALRSLFEALLELGLQQGADVKACPCKTIVPLYRRHVFAQIKPTTNTRIDFGLCLRDYKGKLPKRVVPTGGMAKGDRITHRMEITQLADIDVEVKKWLKTAYQLDR